MASSVIGKKKREAGICSDCSRYAKPGYSRCEDHLELRREYQENKRRAIIEVDVDGEKVGTVKASACEGPLGVSEEMEKHYLNISKENDRLRDQLQLFRRNKKFNHRLLRDDNTYKIGYVTDTHIGSLYSNQGILESAYDMFLEEGITDVYHSGDICDGEKMYRGQEYEIYCHGADAQIEECVKIYPHRSGIMTHFIAGNHDMSFWKHSGTEIGPKIDAERPDMEYLGPEEADVMFGDKNSDRRCIVRLAHPGKGTAYALSYQPQKYVEALSGGEKPEIVLIGHYHKAELMPMYRNVLAVQGGTCCSQTPFMRQRSLSAHVGFWIIEFNVNKGQLVSRFKGEFTAAYEAKS